MLDAAEPGLVDLLLLLSYPLHPPQRPGELRTGHFPRLQTPAMFVHGTRDGFGSIDEVTVALKLIRAEVHPGTNRTASDRGCGARTHDEAESR